MTVSRRPDGSSAHFRTRNKNTLVAPVATDAACVEAELSTLVSLYTRAQRRLETHTTTRHVSSRGVGGVGITSLVAIIYGRQ